MAKIHHATRKLADKLGIALTQDGDNFTATFQGHTLTDTDPKELVTRMAAVAKAGKPDTQTKEANMAKKSKAKTKKPAAQAKGNIIKPEYREDYIKNGGNCGDKLADALRNATSPKNDKGKHVFDAKAFDAVCKENGDVVPAGRWSTLNNGQRAMNLSNVLRAAIKRGEKVTVAGKSVKL